MRAAEEEPTHLLALKLSRVLARLVEAVTDAFKEALEIRINPLLYPGLLQRRETRRLLALEATTERVGKRVTDVERRAHVAEAALVGRTDPEVDRALTHRSRSPARLCKIADVAHRL